jgi:hypothetical protein
MFESKKRFQTFDQMPAKAGEGCIYERVVTVISFKNACIVLGGR